MYIYCNLDLGESHDSTDPRSFVERTHIRDEYVAYKWVYAVC